MKKLLVISCVSLSLIGAEEEEIDFTGLNIVAIKHSQEASLNESITNVNWNFDSTNYFQLTLSTNLTTNWFSFQAITNKPRIFHIQVGRICTNRILILQHRGLSNITTLDTLGVDSQAALFRTNRVK